MKTRPEQLQCGKNMLFIGGAPRSGTTLMQRIMGAHSQVYAGPEFDFIPTHINKLRAKMLGSIRSGRIKPIVDECDLDQALGLFITSIFEKRLEQRWSQDFGPVATLWRLTKELPHDEAETLFGGVQGQGCA